MEKEFYVIAFESTHYAIMVEKKLKDKYNIQTIPTPREITASCGLSIMFKDENLDDIVKEEMRHITWLHKKWIEISKAD